MRRYLRMFSRSPVTRDDGDTLVVNIDLDKGTGIYDAGFAACQLIRDAVEVLVAAQIYFSGLAHGDVGIAFHLVYCIRQWLQC